MYQSILKPPIPPPPMQTPGYLTFLKNFGQNPHYVACLDGQMPCLMHSAAGDPTTSVPLTSFLVKFPTVRNLMRVKHPGIPPDCLGLPGGDGQSWN